MTTSTRLFHGLPVRDATVSRVIKVSKADVTGGGYNPNYCVVQHALGRKENGHLTGEAYPTKIYILSDDTTFWWRYATSSRLELEIKVHDRGGAFAEGEYLIKPVPKSVRFGMPTPRSKPGAKRRAHSFIPGVRERAIYKRDGH
jgi:hypothetical protein